MWTAAAIVFGGYALIIWLNCRDTPETRSRAECLRSTVPLRNELANIFGALGALVLLLALATSSSLLTYAGGTMVSLAFLMGWSADRRERAAEALEPRHGN
jgi:hypothetical protein